MDRITLSSMLRKNVDEHGDRPMFRFDGRTVTWSEHYQRACALSQALQAEGLGVGDRVAFLDRNGLEYFEVLFGGALLGAVNVAVNWRLSAPEMAAVIDDARASILVVHPDYVGHLAGMESGLPSVRRVVVIGDPSEGTDAGGASDAARRVGYEEWLSGQPAVDPGYVGEPDDVALQLYTSGTTGLPKGVMLANRNVDTAFGDGAIDTFEIDEHTVSLVAMPLFHIGGSGWAVGAMSRGGTSVILREIDAGELLRLVEAEGITHAFVVPAVLMVLLMTPAIDTTDLTSLSTIFYGASPIAEDVLVKCMDVFRCRFAQVYGMTETTGAITRLDPEDHDPGGPRHHLLRSAGKPLNGVEIRIIDPDTGEEAAQGAVGELWTRSGYNMLGYWEKPEETAATLMGDGWLRTGDAGYLDAEGYLYLHDRIKDMVVSGGENVYPADVENVLVAHPGVADAAVIGVPDERWGETVKAIVVRAPGTRAAPEEIIAFCRERLAHYKCPTSIDFAETLPRNPSGKILKRELREPYWQGRERNIQ
jgi:long-chain acyl-CoA synthetase